MFCPVCRDEFREGFSRCPDCDVSLVVRLSEPEPETSSETAGAETAFLEPSESVFLEPSESVVVFETEDPSLGGVIKGLLESAGIPVAADHLSPTAWLEATKGINMAGPIRIRVPRDQEADARALLAEQPLSAEPEQTDDDG
jgi:hypothetical protein